MRRRIVKGVPVFTVVALLLSICAQAEPKKKIYNNPADQVFKAALRTARERHVVTYVDEKTLMFTFETGRSFTSEGFVANASVEPEGDDKATLIINVQTKKGFSWGAATGWRKNSTRRWRMNWRVTPSRSRRSRLPRKRSQSPTPKRLRRNHQ